MPARAWPILFCLAAGLLATNPAAALPVAASSPPASTRPTAAAAYGPLQELITPSFDYAGWFQTQTTYQGNAAYFGAYALTPVTQTLYIGLGAARPAESDGALLALYDGATLTALQDTASGFLREQGFIDMIALSDTLVIPGPDPCCGDDWKWGNVYTYDILTQQKTKYRVNNGLVNILHDWGIWHDGANTLYMATSACHESISDPTDTTCAGKYLGKIFTSVDGGAAWAEIARGDADPIGAYRTYDILGLGAQLYAVWNDDYTRACGIARSVNGGNTWTRIADLHEQVLCRARLAAFNGDLLALKHDRTALYTLASNGAVTSHALPGFTVRDWSYNPFAVDGDGVLYLPTDDGRIMGSVDLATWQTMASTDRTLFTLAYWPDQNWLAAADRGKEHASLWRLDLDTAAALTLPAPPAPTASIEDGELRLEWAAGAASYRVYRSASPYFTSHISLLHAEIGQTHLLDPVLGDAGLHHFYIVRGVDAASNLSLESQILGEFEFALTPGT